MNMCVYMYTKNVYTYTHIYIYMSHSDKQQPKAAEKQHQETQTVWASGLLGCCGLLVQLVLATVRQLLAKDHDSRSSQKLLQDF